MQKMGVVVLGISADSSGKQKKFEEKYDLPYTLLADTDKKVCEAFGVIKEKNMWQEGDGCCAHHVCDRTGWKNPACF